MKKTPRWKHKGAKPKKTFAVDAVNYDELYRDYLTKAKFVLPKGQIMNKNSFTTAVAGEIAKGRTVGEGRDIAFLQRQNGYTDKQIDAQWKAYSQWKEKNKFFSDTDFKTRAQFIKGQGWKEVDRLADEIHAKSGQERALIYRAILSPTESSVLGF